MLTGVDEIFMGKLYVPKPPKRRSNRISKSNIINHTLFKSLSISKRLVSLTSHQTSNVFLAMTLPYRCLFIINVAF